MFAVSDGHRTTCIQRPRDATRASLVARREIADRPMPRDSPSSRDPSPRTSGSSKGRGKRVVFALVARRDRRRIDRLVVRVAGEELDAAARRSGPRSRTSSQCSTTPTHNWPPTSVASTLLTGIKEAARQEVGMVGFGEQRISVLTTPNAPLTLPPGWPYDAISQIIAVRAASAAAAARRWSLAGSRSGSSRSGSRPRDDDSPRTVRRPTP